MARTPTEAFGREAVEELAMWAIDALCEAPAKHASHTFAAAVPWRTVDEGRAILDRAGIDWRKIKGDTRSQERVRREAAGDGRVR